MHSVNSRGELDSSQTNSLSNEADFDPIHNVDSIGQEINILCIYLFSSPWNWTSEPDSAELLRLVSAASGSGDKKTGSVIMIRRKLESKTARESRAWKIHSHWLICSCSWLLFENNNVCD